VHLSEFNHQNVISSLTVAGHDQALEWVEVELRSGYGLWGSFRCRQVEVVDVSSYEPAPG